MTVAEKFLKKGAKVYVEGKLETRKWTDRDGTERYTTEIVLRPYSGELLLLDRKEGEPVAEAESGIEDEAPEAEESEAPAKAKKQAGQKR